MWTCQILDTDPALHFALLRLQLIELIRACTSSVTSDITPALNFASSQLAPRAATNPAFLKDLELTMSLLIFLPAAPGTLQKELTELLEPSLRRNVASKVNEVILTSMGAHGESRMRSLVRLRQWAETKVRAAGRDIPSLPLGLQDADERSANGNGEAADVMVQ
jgi:hypothetical protein